MATSTTNPSGDGENSADVAKLKEELESCQNELRIRKGALEVHPFYFTDHQLLVIFIYKTNSANNLDIIRLWKKL